MLLLKIPVDNPNDLRQTDAFGSSAVIRWESSSDGVTFDEIGTTPILANTSFYSFVDPDGTTSTYYRTRYSTGSPAVLDDYSDYSASWQYTLTTYATLDDFVERMTLPDTSRYNLLADLLEASARYLDTRLGFDFLRHPASGTETQTFDVDCTTGRFKIPGGIASITTLQIANGTGASYTTLSASDYYLWPRQLPPGGTYTHVVLLESSSNPVFPYGQGTLRITGAFGFNTVPTLVKEANVVHAARSYHEWETKQAGIVGNPEFGTVSLSPNLPDVVYRTLALYSRYFGIPT